MVSQDVSSVNLSKKVVKLAKAKKFDEALLIRNSYNLLQKIFLTFSFSSIERSLIITAFNLRINIPISSELSSSSLYSGSKFSMYLYLDSR